MPIDGDATVAGVPLQSLGMPAELRASGRFPEEERTVMMTAPPHALFAATAKAAPTKVDEAPPKPRRSPVPDAGVLGSAENAQDPVGLRGPDGGTAFEDPTRATPSQEPRPILDPAESPPSPPSARGYEPPDPPSLAPLEGPSIFLIGGIVFGVAALVLVVGLLIMR